MSDSILTSTKSTLGLADDHTAFDAELITFINAALANLVQVGVGPPSGFLIEDKSATWTNFLGHDERLSGAKTYVSMMTRLMFDPPEIGFVITAMKQNLEETLWRLNVIVDDQIPVPVGSRPIRHPKPGEIIFDGGAP